MSFACHLYALIFYLYVFVCHSYVSRMYSYVICMSLVCTRMSSVCHSYVLVCHPYVTHMYSYVTRVSLVFTRMSSVCLSYMILLWIFKKLKFLNDTVYFRGNTSCCKKFILIVSNHRKMNNFVICYSSVCKYCLQIILFQCGIRL